MSEPAPTEPPPRPGPDGEGPTAPDPFGPILVVDTTDPGEGRVGLVADDALLAWTLVPDAAQDLAPALAGLLTRHPLPPCLGVAVVGPGSFTGIRAGLALLAGLAIGSGLPLAAATRAEALAALLPPMTGPLLVARDARLGRFAVERVPAGQGPRAADPGVELLTAQGLAEAALALPEGGLLLAEPSLPGTLSIAPPAPELRLLGAARVGLARHQGRLPARPVLPLYGEALAAKPVAASRPAPRA